MNKHVPHAFVNQMLVYALVLIGFGGSMGMGAVWLRHQMSVTAETNRRLESKIVATERLLVEKTAAIEQEQSPDVLKSRNQMWGLGLVPPTEPQVCRVREDVTSRLAAKRNRGLFSDGASFVLLRTGGNDVQ